GLDRAGIISQLDLRPARPDRPGHSLDIRPEHRDEMAKLMRLYQLAQGRVGNRLQVRLESLYRRFPFIPVKQPGGFAAALDGLHPALVMLADSKDQAVLPELPFGSIVI